MDEECPSLVGCTCYNYTCATASSSCFCKPESVWCDRADIPVPRTHPQPSKAIPWWVVVVIVVTVMSAVGVLVVYYRRHRKSYSTQQETVSIINPAFIEDSEHDQQLIDNDSGDDDPCDAACLEPLPALSSNNCEQKTMT
ncbi:uncharacterized protein [Anabrus simplex]|uniref:uncharacterized protein n=1 Tax=Anabrus simplex TaxID=316456 RepID=UPI0035A35632